MVPPRALADDEDIELGPGRRLRAGRSEREGCRAALVLQRVAVDAVRHVPLRQDAEGAVAVVHDDLAHRLAQRAGGARPVGEQTAIEDGEPGQRDEHRPP